MDLAMNHPKCCMRCSKESECSNLADDEVGLSETGDARVFNAVRSTTTRGMVGYELSTIRHHFRQLQEGNSYKAVAVMLDPDLPRLFAQSGWSHCGSGTLISGYKYADSALELCQAFNTMHNTKVFTVDGPPR